MGQCCLQWCQWHKSWWWRRLTGWSISAWWGSLAVLSALFRRMYNCLLSRTVMTLVVSQVEVRSLSVYDQQPVYSLPKCVRLKGRCVESLCFALMGTYIIDRSCVFVYCTRSFQRQETPIHVVKVDTVLISKWQCFSNEWDSLMGCCCKEDMCALLVNQPTHLKNLLSFHLGIYFVGFHVGSKLMWWGWEEICLLCRKFWGNLVSGSAEDWSDSIRTSRVTDTFLPSNYFTIHLNRI